MKQSLIKKICKTALAAVLGGALFMGAAFSSSAAVLGIDVSKWNGGIDWGAVRGAGVTYAFVKAGSTNKGQDPNFAANVVGAQSAGIRTGAYIYSYAQNVDQAVNEANLILQWIEGYNINFPVAFDIEDPSQKGIDAGTVTAMCNAFCDVIANAGYYPIVYTGTNFYQRHMTGDLRYDKWIAQYSDHCDIPGLAIWQNSCTGRIAGIPSNVDTNQMYKDYNTLIIPEGFLNLPDATYLFKNFRKQFGWTIYNEQKYHLDGAGRMNLGWFADESGTYYLAEDGHALMGQNAVGSDNFYFNENGCVVGGWVTLGENQFFYNPADGCRMVKGWFDDETGRHYLFPEDGHLVKGNIEIDKKVYLFNDKGSMVTGMTPQGDAVYYYDPATGARVTGFVGDIASGRYYFSEADAKRVYGMVPVGDKVYLFDKDGKMQIGMQTVGDGSYYFDPATGSRVTGFVGDITSGRYYFSEADARRVSGMVPIGDKVYLFAADGKMQVGMQNVGETSFYFDPATGARITGLLPLPDGTYYAAEDGHIVKNQLQNINGINYVFTPEGRMVCAASITLPDGITYTTDATGQVISPIPEPAPAAAN